MAEDDEARDTAPIPLALRWRGAAKWWFQLGFLAVLGFTASVPGLGALESALVLGGILLVVPYVFFTSSVTIDEDSVVVSSTFARPLRTTPDGVVGYFLESWPLGDTPVRIVLVLPDSPDWSPTRCIDFTSQAKLRRVTAALDAVGIRRLDAGANAHKS